MVESQKVRRLALAAELEIHEGADLLAFREQFIRPEDRAALPELSVPMVYPFESDTETEAIEDHIITALSGVPKFKILLRGITGYPGGFVLMNVKTGNDRLILVHDLLHQGALAAASNPLYTFFPHVLLFRCGSPEDTKTAVLRGQALQKGFEATVRSLRIEEVADNGAVRTVSAIDLE
jgi:hypothetical protein